MYQYRRIRVGKLPRAHQERPAGKLLFGGAERNRNPAGQLVFVDHRLDRLERAKGNAAMGVVTFHVARGACHQRLARHAARCLRPFRKCIDFSDDHHMRLAAAIGRPYRRRHPGAAGLDLETHIRQGFLEKLRALEFLHAGLGVEIKRISYQSDFARIAIDGGKCDAFLFIGGRNTDTRHCS